MDVKIKNVHYYERMSEETNCFVADLIINDKHVGTCKNDGRGGQTYYIGKNEESDKLITECEEYCKTLPKKKIEEFDIEIDQTLDVIIDDLLSEYLRKKEEKKMLKQMEKSILVGVPNGYSYKKYSWSNKLLSEVPLPILQFEIDKIRKNECKDGVKILNTNLETLGIR